MVPVPRGSNDIRISLDMRRANEAIKDDKFPLPTVDDLLPCLNKASVFSTLDLKLAFHEIELNKNSREVTTYFLHAMGSVQIQATDV